jgi:hypothetical protein
VKTSLDMAKARGVAPAILSPVLSEVYARTGGKTAGATKIAIEMKSRRCANLAGLAVAV